MAQTALLAYRYVTLCVMLGELNYCVSKLQIPIPTPITTEDLHFVHIPDPRMFGNSGRVDTKQYLFSFDDGRLSDLTYLLEDVPRDFLDAKHTVASVAGTNEAYQISRKWLLSLEVDIERLERDHPPRIEERLVTPPQSYGSNSPPYRVFDIDWGRWKKAFRSGDWRAPVASVQISAQDGRPLFVRQQDLSFSRRPSLITNLDELLKIPDQDFLTYSPSQRSNLVAEFSAVKYDRVTISGPRPHLPLAFEFVAVAAMSAEANYCATKLKLAEDLPLIQAQLKSRYVVPPELTRLNGRLETSRYSYHFSQGGRLWQIKKLDPFGGMTHLEATRALKNVKSKINTKGALQVARTWLELLSADMREMERTNLFRCRQEIWLDPEGGTPKPIPIFDATWGHPSYPKASVCIDGRTRELISLKLEDDSFSRRPRELLKNCEGMLAISDDEFQKLSQSEKSQLAKRFFAVDYPEK